jgi:UDP-N-acetylglucosamine--N-acetylmuramyl-(pentapeptide) pyrophosphoryl-undecaprenol N-acetylglucosamine transferase
MIKKIIIATGGTGGHIFPAYSLAKYLIKKNYNVILTSDKRGLKFLKSYKDLNLIQIPSSPLLKKNIIQFLLSVIVIVYSIIKSFIFLTLKRPSVVFGMGGYSSFPICIAAWILRINFIIYENNLILGKANKYLLPFAKKIFVSFKDIEGISEKYNDKVIEIGNIVREEIINTKVNNNQNYKTNEIKILVLGGSQAAKVFAIKLPEIFKKLKQEGSLIKIYQQCQNSQNVQLSKFYQNEKIEHELFNFTDNIINYYSKVNLVITRSGASVLGELINFKIPFISIPLTTSADNHQYKNAEFYSKKGYGYLVEEKDINKRLFELLISILKDKLSLQNIISNQRQHSDKNIFKNLSIHIEKFVNGKN